jgi:arylsulfatase A-like enzyme
MNLNMTSKTFTLSCLLLILGCSTAQQATGTEQRPNIVIFLADDQGYGDLSMTGNKNINTPHIDSLGKDGVIFDNFYVCAVCSPTRAEFLTGRYHQRMGVRSTSTGGERFNTDETTIGHIFKKAGYATGAFGKWHSGMQYPYHPNGRGFDEYYGFCSGHWGNYFNPVLEHNGKQVRGKGFIIDDLTDKAMEFIKTNKDKPFLCYIPYCTPHKPFQVPDKYFDRFKDKELSLADKSALAMCENIDHNVGRVLKQLKRLKLSDNTIVIYFSDNGPNGNRWNDGMKGVKGSTDEGGVRSAFVLRWPAKIKKHKRIEVLSGAIDLLPTLAALAGISAKTNKPLDGKNLKTLIFEENPKWESRYLINAWSRGVSIRTQDFRLDRKGKLFKMPDDRAQKNDLSKKHPELTARLKTIQKDWAAKHTLQRNVKQTFPVGYKEFPITQLPARDAKTTGQIKRSSKHPNCTYFFNWTSKAEAITWDIDVNTTGRYEVEVYYTCAKSDLGCELELSFKNQKVKNSFNIAHNPAPYGMKEDRVKRTESYIKDFKKKSFGQINLSKGEGLLSLKALKIPGNKAIDFRLLILTLKD